ncbi:MAG TPA: hypothetical protein VME92_15570 [Acetobacteraceae bacterium]|nr:hypothetical protein [Acetobacteraceae bacterium]
MRESVALAMGLMMLTVTVARAAEPSDAALVALCLAELKSRQPPDEVQSNTRITTAHIERSARQQVVDIQGTEAEGRPVGGRCIVRNGRVFDFRD